MFESKSPCLHCLRTAQISLHNLIIENSMLHHEITFFRPLKRRNLVNHMEEIHSRIFYDVKFMVTYNFEVFGQLAKLIALKEK